MINRSKKLIYVASPFAGGPHGTIQENIAFAKGACLWTINEGEIPFVPHLLYTQVLDDDIPGQRAVGLGLAIDAMLRCDEVWFFGPRMSSGMVAEKELALQERMVVRHFDIHDDLPEGFPSCFAETGPPVPVLTPEPKEEDTEPYHVCMKKMEMRMDAMRLIMSEVRDTTGNWTGGVLSKIMVAYIQDKLTEGIGK